MALNGILSLWGNFGLMKPLYNFNDMLNKPDLKIETLLDEEDFLVEFKQMNPKLLDFFSNNKNNLKTLISLIIEDPIDYSDIKRCYKYPFIASEIFEFETNIINAFFQESETTIGSDSNPTEIIPEIIPEVLPDITENENKNFLLDYLFSIMDNKVELNETMAGYYQKVIFSIYKRKTKELVEYVYAQKDLLEKFLRQITVKTMTEIFVHFVAVECTKYDEKNEGYKKKKIDILKELLNILLSSQDSEAVANASLIITHILKRYSLVWDGTDMLNFFLLPENIRSIFDSIKSNKTCNRRYILEIISLLSSYFCPFEDESSLINDYHIDKNENNKFIFQRNYDDIEFVSILLENLDVLFKGLNEGYGLEVKTTYGESLTIFGEERFKILETIENCMKYNSSKINSILAEKDVMTSIMSLFFKYEWNNILHRYLHRIIYSIILKNNEFFIKELFEKAKLLEIIAKNTDQIYSSAIKSKNKFRKGYIGYIIDIANLIHIQKDHNKFIEAQIEKSEPFKFFSGNFLKNWNEENKKTNNENMENPLNFYMKTQNLQEPLFANEGASNYQENNINMEINFEYKKNAEIDFQQEHGLLKEEEKLDFLEENEIENSIFSKPIVSKMNANTIHQGDLKLKELKYQSYQNDSLKGKKENQQDNDLHETIEENIQNTENENEKEESGKNSNKFEENKQNIHKEEDSEENLSHEEKKDKKFKMKRRMSRDDAELNYNENPLDYLFPKEKEKNLESPKKINKECEDFDIKNHHRIPELSKSFGNFSDKKEEKSHNSHLYPLKNPLSTSLVLDNKKYKIVMRNSMSLSGITRAQEKQIDETHNKPKEEKEIKKVINVAGEVVKKKKFRKINDKDLKFVNYINEQIEMKKSETSSEMSDLNSVNSESLESENIEN